MTTLPIKKGDILVCVTTCTSWDQFTRQSAIKKGDLITVINPGAGFDYPYDNMSKFYVLVLVNSCLVEIDRLTLTSEKYFQGLV
jgi:hypothetical protein